MSMTSERKNISNPRDWWAAFETQARADGMSLSEWVGECCKANLPKGTKLSERPAAHRPRKE